jgi:hypothetical protein
MEIVTKRQSRASETIFSELEYHALKELAAANIL